MDDQTLPACAKCPAFRLPFTGRCWPFGPEYDVFKVSGEIFILITELRGQSLINLRSDPQKSLLDQQIYPSTKPGYHMNKRHWISVYPGGDITESLLAELVNDSWRRVVDGLPKRDQERLHPG